MSHTTYRRDMVCEMSLKGPYSLLEITQVKIRTFPHLEYDHTKILSNKVMSVIIYKLPSSMAFLNCLPMPGKESLHDFKKV